MDTQDQKSIFLYIYIQTTHLEVFPTNFVLRPKLEKNGKDEKSEVDSDATLGGDSDTTVKTWKETSEILKEEEATHDLEKASHESMRTTSKSSWNHKKTKKLEFSNSKYEDKATWNQQKPILIMKKVYNDLASRLERKLCWGL